MTQKFLRSLNLFSWSRKFLSVWKMSSNTPVFGPYFEPLKCSPYLHTPRSLLKLSSHLRLGLPRSLFHSDLPTKILHTILSSPLCATPPAYIFLNLITLLIKVKGKVVSVLHSEPRHEDILGEWRYSSTHSLTSY
jgi:hypothetical protein